MAGFRPQPAVYQNLDGTLTVEVQLSPSEWRRIQKRYPRALTGQGSGSASIRKALGFHEVPKRPYPLGKP